MAVTATDFIREVEALGCELLTDGERVGLRGPGEALARLRPDLARLKPELLRVLRDGTLAGDPWPAGIPRPRVKPGCDCPACDWTRHGYRSQLEALRSIFPEAFREEGDR